MISTLSRSRPETSELTACQTRTSSLRTVPFSSREVLTSSKSHVADRLLADGAKEVRLFDNFSLGTAATIAHLRDDPRAPLLRGDVLRLNKLIDAATGVNGVFALAGFLTIPMPIDPVQGVSVN